jgi:hypothetical protein
MITNVTSIDYYLNKDKFDIDQFVNCYYIVGELNETASTIQVFKGRKVLGEERGLLDVVESE